MDSLKLLNMCIKPQAQNEAHDESYGGSQVFNQNYDINLPLFKNDVVKSNETYE